MGEKNLLFSLQSACKTTRYRLFFNSVKNNHALIWDIVQTCTIFNTQSSQQKNNLVSWGFYSFVDPYFTYCNF